MILRGSNFSRSLEMETGLSLIVPESFQEGVPFKVAYLLHGLCGRSGDWADYTMLPLYARDYQVVFVMPEVGRSFYTDMKYGQRFFRYVSEELPEICKSVLNISEDRENVAVIGASMGGYGALKCALSRPERYGYCCAFSSPCLFLKEGLEVQRAMGETEEFRRAYGGQLFKDFQGIFGERLEWKPENDLCELAKGINVYSEKPSIYLACGTEDRFYDENRRFCEEIGKLGIGFTYEEWAGSHDWVFFNEALKRSLEWCFAGKDR